MWSTDFDSVLVHRRPGRKTVSIGVWFAHGAAHDPLALAGATHLVEHLTLRRCGGRDRRSLAELMDRLGGEVDAWTSSETMGLAVQTTSDALPEALGILRDAALEPSFAEEDVNLERQIALAELELMHDDPAERVGEAILKAAWGDHPLATPIIGTPETLENLGPRELETHHRDRLLRQGGLLLAVVGDVDLDHVARELKGLPLGPGVHRPSLEEPTWVGGRLRLDRGAADQVHVRQAFPAVSIRDPQAPVVAVVSRILGSGHSSRLFQRLREDEGLTYDVWSDILLRSVGGMLEVGWACSPDRFSTAWAIVEEEIFRLPSDISDREVEVAVQGMVRGLQMEAETAAGTASLDVAEVLERGRRFDIDSVVKEICSITPEQVREVARMILKPEIMASAICGPEGSWEAGKLAR
ncbi:MAG: insulinase family protein [Acidobacteria bacterium]|nr:insulinase family protein [Acidobacteriota bacterium]